MEIGVNLNSAKNVSLHTDVTKILASLCFSPKYSGYAYVREAVKLAVELGGEGAVSKNIYPAVAKISRTTVSAVESGIRTAIRRAWARADKSIKVELFGAYAVYGEHTPTNSEFIFMLADRLSYSSVM